MSAHNQRIRAAEEAAGVYDDDKGVNMEELIDRLIARGDQVSETWVKDDYREGYLDALKDVITVAELLEEEN